MSDLKLNGITPDGVGKIKLGGSNVQKIYSASTLVWPTSIDPEVQICSYIWTTTNSTITDTTTGGTIPIATNAADFLTYHNAQQPAAMYWNFDSNNSERGLLYNQYAARVIQPPAGFVVSSTTSFATLQSCNNSNPNMNRFGADPGNWNSNLNYRDQLGDTILNFNGYGEAVLYGTTSVTFTRDTWSTFQWTTTRIGSNLGPNLGKRIEINQSGQFRTLILTTANTNTSNKAGYIRFFKPV